MDRKVHLVGPPADLLIVAESVSADWIRRLVTDTAFGAGVDVSMATDSIDRMVVTTTNQLISSLHDLLVEDVDGQRTTPLSVFRSAIAAPTELLLELDVPVSGSGRHTDRFPGDVFGLSPATWSDIDPQLHEPGIVWGAWKAMTILERRRSEP